MEDGFQEIVDALSVRLGRPVLVDDVDLRPLAYSTQFGELDSVRTASILGRTAPDSAARRAVRARHPRGARAGPHPRPPDIGMEARACIPILRGNRRLGFLWLIEDRPLDEEELRLARAAATEAATVLQSEADSQLDRRRREQELIVALLAGDARAAAAALEADRYLPQRPLIVCVGRRTARRRRRRPPARPRARQARAVRRGRRGACVWLIGPLRGAQLAEALGRPRRRGRRDRGPERGAGSYEHALAALRAAADQGAEVARWDDLRAYRLLTALPPTAFEDLPERLRQLLDGSHEQLVLTLETYLDHAGDVKRTAAELWLHRTSLYYRLRRIEEVADVDLSRGEDRLLCHVALRLAKLQRTATETRSA